MQRREIAGLLLAASAHALLLLAPRFFPGMLGRVDRRAADGIAVDAIDVETLNEPAPPASAAPSEPAAAPSGAAADERAAVAMNTNATGARAERGRSAEKSPESPEAPRAPGAGGPPHPGDEYGGPPAAPDALVAPPGLGGRPAWTIPGAVPAPDAAPAAPTRAAPSPEVPKDIASRVLSGTMNTREHEVGIDLPAAGVVAGVLSDAVRSASTEPEARATFEVRLGAQGQVLGVRVKSFSAGSADSWDRAAKTAATALSKRGLAVNENQPVTIVVKVETAQRYPAGSKKRVDVKPVCANEVLEEISDALTDPASIGAKPPIPPEDNRQKFCIPIGVAGVVDPSNLGAHLQTVVRSTYKIVRGGDIPLPSGAAKPLEDRAPWLDARASRSERPEPAWKDKKKKKKDKDKDKDKK